MRGYRKASAQTRGAQIVEKSEALEARVSVELPVSVAEVIDGLWPIGSNAGGPATCVCAGSLRACLRPKNASAVFADTS